MLVVWGWSTFDVRNWSTAPGRCEACGYSGELGSYDGLRRVSRMPGGARRVAP
jgi:hypothetical protein